MDGNEGVLFASLDGKTGFSIFPDGDPLPCAARAGGVPLARDHIAVAPGRQACLQRGIQSANNEKRLVTGVSLMRPAEKKGMCEWRCAAWIAMYHENIQLSIGLCAKERAKLLWLVGFNGAFMADVVHMIRHGQSVFGGCLTRRSSLK